MFGFHRSLLSGIVLVASTAAAPLAFSAEHPTPPADCPGAANGPHQGMMMGRGMGTMNMPMMKEHMQQMREGMKKLHDAKTPQERTRLMEEQMQLMTDQMQMMTDMMDRMHGPHGPMMQSGSDAKQQ